MIIERTSVRIGSGIAGVVSCLVAILGDVEPVVGADVEITANTTSVNLDTLAGTTVHVATGVTVGPPPLPSGPALNATLQAWTLTNDGSLSGDNTVNFMAGGTVNNSFGATIASTGASAIVLGDFLAGGVGAVTNAGTITGGPFADTVELFGGGAVTNLATGSITAINGNNAVSISGGTSRSVVNSGLISSTGSNFATGILLQGTGATNTITNTASGRIFGGFNGIFTSSDVVLTLNNFGSIASTIASAVQATGGGTFTNRGTITSSGLNGILIGDGAPAEIINSGTISGATNAIDFTDPSFGGPGATHTLRLQTGSVLNGNVLGGSGIDSLVLEGSGTETISKFFNFETLSMQGQDWTLSGSGTFSISTTVRSGTLRVLGQLTSPAVSVRSGGTLTGDGTIVGDTAISGGALAPGNVGGNVFGPLTVQGSLSFTAASTYLIQVSPANAGRTNVSGTATLGGATVNAVFQPGSYINRQYTILNAAGGVSGTFNPAVVSNMANIQSTLSYDAHDAFLNINILFSTANGLLNVNQQNVANALTNYFNRNGGIPFAFAALSPAGLTMASGELPTAAQQTTFDAMNLFLGLLTDPFVAGRGNPVAPSAGATPFAEEDSAYVAIYRKAPLAQSYDPRWSVWAAGFGGSQTTDGNAALGSNPATSRVFGTAVGADYLFSPYTLAGFALAGGGTNFSIANGLGSGRSDLFQAGTFVRHTAGPAYVSGALAYGWQDVTTDRTVTIAGIDQLRARFNANAFSGRLESGYRFVPPWMAMGVTPYAAGQFTTFDLPAYAEQVLSGANTFALAYGSKSVTDPRSELGVRTDKSWAMQNAILTLRGRFAWAHDYDPNRTTGATFQTLPGASFVVNGAAQAHDSALTTASAEMKWINGWSVAATFEGEFSNVTSSYAGKGVVRYQW